MVSALTFVSIAASAVALLGSTDAHQRVIAPEPTYTVADRGTNWSPIAFLENQGVKTTDDILGYVKSKNVKNLREFLDNKANYRVEPARATFECGFTDPNGARRPVPANGMMRSSGYTHEGPCEIWIDNTMVKKGDNCNKEIGSSSVSYKIDFSACRGDCMLRWYWFAYRPIGSKRSFQVYKACIPMKGSGGSRGVNGTSEVGGEGAAPPPLAPANPDVTKDASKCKAKRN